MSEDEVQDMLLSVEIDKRGEIDYKRENTDLILFSVVLFEVIPKLMHQNNTSGTKLATAIGSRFDQLQLSVC